MNRKPEDRKPDDRKTAAALGADAAKRRFGHPVSGIPTSVFLRYEDRIIRVGLLLLAMTAIAGLAIITFYIFREGLPLILRIGLTQFVGSSDWRPTEGHYGIFPMIIGSLAVTGGAMIIGVALGLACAILLTQFCPPKLVAVIKPAIELLAGIPSVVYGFMGLVLLVPFIRDYIGGPGLSILAASVVLGIMVLPTVTSISVDALRAVPRSYIEGSIALGATHWQTTHQVVLKAARSGILAAIILGMGRAVGETMAVIMVAGNMSALPDSILDPVRTLTSNIALEMSYASDEPFNNMPGVSHQKALFATGVTLFVIIMILNSVALAISARGSRRRTKR